MQNSNFYDLLGAVGHCRLQWGGAGPLAPTNVPLTLRIRLKLALRLWTSLFGQIWVILKHFKWFEIFGILELRGSKTSILLHLCWNQRKNAVFSIFLKFQFFPKFLFLIQIAWNRSMISVRIRKSLLQWQKAHRSHWTLMNRHKRRSRDMKIAKSKNRC